MPPTTITDIVPTSPGNDVTAVVQDSSTVTHSCNPSETLAVLEPLFGEFYSAIWDDPAAENTALTVAFG
jgi:hypothetical protein